MDDDEVVESAEVEENKEWQDEDRPGKKKEPDWKKYQNMSVEDKRKYYKCGDDYIQIKDVETWPEFFQDNGYLFSKIQKRTKMENSDYHVDANINNKISLWEGDITRLEIDAIVNAANRSLLGGGGVDGCIHRAAGKNLVEECRLLNGCETGDAKITSGHKLPAKHVIHTVGPIGKNEKALKSCYEKCLKVALENEVRTLAFCCISTGIYGYPNRDAAEVALRTTRKWLEDEGNAKAVDRIIFCLFLAKDIEIYRDLMLKYFPPGELKKPTKKSDKTAKIPAKLEEDEETRKKEPRKKDANHKDEDSTTKSDENLEAESEPGKGNKEMETEAYQEKDEKKVASKLKDAIETTERKENLGSYKEMKRVEQLQKERGVLEDGGDNSHSKTEERQTGEENISKEKKKEEKTQMGRKVKENANSSVKNPTSKKQKQDNVNESDNAQDAEMTEVQLSPGMQELKTEEKEQDQKMDVGKETSL